MPSQRHPPCRSFNVHAAAASCACCAPAGPCCHGRVHDGIAVPTILHAVRVTMYAQVWTGCQHMDAALPQVAPGGGESQRGQAAPAGHHHAFSHARMLLIDRRIL